ncbi:MAG: nucleotide exchange factor GrpE [Solirubrobacterales bacterium]|nr:nucleotide exchange factor GrpE [Solirubrobacterales bacterium]
MTDSNDIIRDGTDGSGEVPAGRGNPLGRTTSDAAEAETAASPGSTPSGSSEPDGFPTSEAEDAEIVEEELDELAQAVLERDEFKDLALRAKADFENYRKRADKRVAETRGVAVAGVIRELLPVVDNLDRAVEAAGAVADGDAFAEGVRLVHADLHSVLDRLGLTQQDPTGQQFDPNFHQAISQAPATDTLPAGTIVETVQKGFLLGEVVVRPASVVVAA